VSETHNINNVTGIYIPSCGRLETPRGRGRKPIQEWYEALKSARDTPLPEYGNVFISPHPAMTFMFGPGKPKYLAWRADNVITHNLAVEMGDDWHKVEQLYKVANFKGAYSSSRNEPPDIATGKDEVLQIHAGVWRRYNLKAHFTAESFPPTAEAQSALDNFLMKFREKIIPPASRILARYDQRFASRMSL